MWKKINCGEDCNTYLELFFNSMNEAFAFHEVNFDETGKPIDYEFLEVNNSFVDVTGLKREDIIGKRATEVISGLEQSWIDIYGNVAMNGIPISFENYNAQLDRYFKVSAFSPVRGQFTTIFHDITELKKATEIMKRHQLLFDNAQDIIFYATADGSVIDANVNAALQYGYNLCEIIKLNVQDLRYNSSNVLFMEQMKEADEKGITFETLHVRKDGTCFPVEVSVKSVLIDDHRLRIHIVRDVSERKLAEEKIMYLANYDSLTEIPNRAYLMNHLKLTLENARRGNFKFALMLFDIDKFKEVNDIYGHESGDVVLRETARIIQNTIRKVDFVARLGGDEFVIIQPYVNGQEECSILASRILEQFKTPLNIGKEELNIALSIGISIYQDDATNEDILMSFSDKAMYRVKQNGGGSFEFYSNIKTI